jgi:hypothetical protein
MATATRKPRDSKPRDTGTAADSGAARGGRAGLSRAVIWAGLALGTAVTVLAVMNGVRVPRLETVLSVLATWALLALLAIVIVELLRRHRRAIAGHAARHGKRGAVAAARATRSGARSATAWLVSRAGPRWASREHRPLMFRKLRQDEATGTRRLDGKPETDADKRFFDLREAGYTGPINQDGYAVPDAPPPEHTDTDGGTTSMAVSKIAPERRARRTAARTGGSMPAAWGPVIALAADFEPEDDGQLLDWMNGQVTGISGYGEALVDLYDHCTNVIGIDPAASALLHDVADAVAHAAEAMSAAKQKFVDHYELPREFAGNGSLMTHDGRWVTGEGA